MILEVPDVELVAILSFRDMAWIEALGEAIRIAPLRGDHDIVPQLIPKVLS